MCGGCSARGKREALAYLPVARCAKSARGNAARSTVSQGQRAGDGAREKKRERVRGAVVRNGATSPLAHHAKAPRQYLPGSPARCGPIIHEAQLASVLERNKETTAAPRGRSAFSAENLLPGDQSPLLNTRESASCFLRPAHADTAAGTQPRGHSRAVGSGAPAACAKPSPLHSAPRKGGARSSGAWQPSLASSEIWEGRSPRDTWVSACLAELPGFVLIRSASSEARAKPANRIHLTLDFLSVCLVSLDLVYLVLHPRGSSAGILRNPETQAPPPETRNHTFWNER